MERGFTVTDCTCRYAVAPEALLAGDVQATGSGPGGYDDGMRSDCPFCVLDDKGADRQVNTLHVLCLQDGSPPFCLAGEMQVRKGTGGNLTRWGSSRGDLMHGECGGG